MDHDETPMPPDLSLQLPRSVYWQIVRELQTSLPPPVDDTPEALAHRNNAAIAQIAAMLPVNADEAELAAACVSARAHVRDCQRQAQSLRGDPPWFLKCHAQATSMLRQAQTARRQLQLLQEERRKRESNGEAVCQADWIEHCAVGHMADALGIARPAPIPEPPPAAAPPEPEPALAAPQPFEALTEAERYATLYPRRAAVIRRLGRLPDNPSFGPPPDSVVQALINGRSPILLAIDQEDVETCAV